MSMQTRKRKHENQGSSETSSDVAKTREMSPSPETLAGMTLPGAVTESVANENGIESYDNPPPRKRAKLGNVNHENNMNDNTNEEIDFVLPGAYGSGKTKTKNGNNWKGKNRNDENEKSKNNNKKGYRIHGVSKQLLDKSEQLLRNGPNLYRNEQYRRKREQNENGENNFAMAKLNSDAKDSRNFGNILSYQPTLQQIENHRLYHLAKERWFTPYNSNENDKEKDKEKENEMESGNDNENMSNERYDAKMVDSLFDNEIVGPVANTTHGHLRDRSPQLILLEFTHYLENYLWKHFDRESCNFKYIMSMVIIINEKFNQNIDVWDALLKNESGDATDNRKKLANFFKKLFEIRLQELTAFCQKDNRDNERSKWTMYLREQFTLFLINCNYTFENEIVRFFMINIVGISIWYYIHANQRALILNNLERSQQRKWKEFYKNRDRLQNYKKELYYRMLNEFLIILSETERMVKEYPQWTIENKKEESVDNNNSNNNNNNDIQMNENGIKNEIVVTYLMNCRYIYRFIELLIDNLCNLPTRRYLKVLLESSNVLFIIQCKHSLSPQFYKTNGLFNALVDKLDFYIKFNIDDWNGQPIDETEQSIENYTKLQVLQKACYKYFKEKLSKLAMANVGSIDDHDQLKEYLNELDVNEIKFLCEKLHILPNTNGKDNTNEENNEDFSLLNVGNVIDGSPFENKDFLIEIIVWKHLSVESRHESILKLPLYPTETTLWNDAQLPKNKIRKRRKAQKQKHDKNEFYDNSGESGNTLVLSLPKLNLQFLTIYDYLQRNFDLYRLESAHTIREDVAKCVWKLRPRLKRLNFVQSMQSKTSKKTVFTGYSRMGCLIKDFRVSHIAPIKIGETIPSSVSAVIEIDLRAFSGETLKEWCSLHEHDVLFLVKVVAKEEVEIFNNEEDNDNDFDGNGMMQVQAHGITGVGRGSKHETWENLSQQDLGIEYIRGCCIKYIRDSDDENARIIGDRDWDTNEVYQGTGTKRIISVELDAAQYISDLSNENNSGLNSSHSDEIYGFSKHEDMGFNLLIRRRSKENNFKAVLETIRELLSTNSESAYLNEHKRMWHNNKNNQNTMELSLIDEDIVGRDWCLPSWFHNVFLGYEDPNAATYYKLGALSLKYENERKIGSSMIPDISEKVYIDESHYQEMMQEEKEKNGDNSNEAHNEEDDDIDVTTKVGAAGNVREKYKKLMEQGYYCLDFKDTFLSKEHVLASFPVFDIQFVSSDDDGNNVCAPPYRIWFPKSFLTDMSSNDNFRSNYVNSLLTASLQMVEKQTGKQESSDKHTIFVESYLDISALSASIYDNESRYIAEMADMTSLDSKIVGNHILSLHLDGQHREYVNNLHIRRNNIVFTPIQIEAIKSGLHYGLSMIVGPPGTGKTDVAVQIINNLVNNFENERILMITHSNHALNDLFEKIMLRDINEKYLLRLGYGASDIDTSELNSRRQHNSSNHDSTNLLSKHDFSKYGRINYMLNLRTEYLSDASLLAESVGYSSDRCATCETAVLFFNYDILRLWEDFLDFMDEFEMKYCHIIGNNEKYQNEIIEIEIENENENESGKRRMKLTEFMAQEFPFTKFIQRMIQSKYDSIFGDYDSNENSYYNQLFNDVEKINILKGQSYSQDKQYCYKYWYYISSIFNELKTCHAFELLRTFKDRCDYLLTQQSKIIAMTCTHAAMNRKDFIKMALNYDSIIMEEAAQILDIETFIPIVLQSSKNNNNVNTGSARLKRIILIGDHFQLPPIIKNFHLTKFCRLDQSLFTRLIRLGTPYYLLNMQGRARSSIAKLYSWRYDNLGNLNNEQSNMMYSLANTGFSHEYQCINVDNYLGKGESQPNAYFYQNLGEAEYIVQVYMFMRLLGYPGERITILTSYNGQKHLIREIMNRKCLNDRLYGNCKQITTIDKYQGSQNDYVLLSLVRTNNVGYIRDIRRLIVAMSRSRFGLYIFCRFKLFNNCFELENVFKLLQMKEASMKLKLVTGETWPTQRLVGDNGTSNDNNDNSKNDRNGHFYVENVQHMAYIVEKMSNAVRMHLSKEYDIKLKEYMIRAEKALEEKKAKDEIERKEMEMIEKERLEKEIEKAKQMQGSEPLLEKSESVDTSADENVMAAMEKDLNEQAAQALIGNQNDINNVKDVIATTMKQMEQGENDNEIENKNDNDNDNGKDNAKHNDNDSDSDVSSESSGEN